MTVGDQTSDNIDEGIERAAMPRVFNLRYILELIDHTLNDGALAQKQFVKQGHQPIFHVLPKTSNELDIESIQQLLEE